jgi:Uncharacterized protein conserved in bacteria (DUF2330)
MLKPMLLFLCLAGSWAMADRGVLLFKDINLEEPAQRAIVAHNGTWELLILQTDVRANKAGRAVEFMPLPANPEVSLASSTCFTNLQAIIDKHKIRYTFSAASRGLGGSGERTEGVRIVAEHDLGPHHITVVEIQDPMAFRSWVIDFSRKNSLGIPIVSEKIDKVVADYCERGFNFFVFDVLDVPEGMKSVVPVSYRFKCDHIYYPLKVTNLYGGVGTVEVFFIVSPWCDNKAHGVKMSYFFNRTVKRGENWGFNFNYPEVMLSSSELEMIDSSLASLFRGGGASFLATKYQGKLHFDEDIWIGMGYASPDAVCVKFTQLLIDKDIDSMEYLISTPFAFGRQTVFKDRRAVMEELKRFGNEQNLLEFREAQLCSKFLVGDYVEFDRTFVDKYIKTNNWQHCAFRTTTNALNFWTVNANTTPHTGLSKCKVAGFWLTPIGVSNTNRSYTSQISTDKQPTNSLVSPVKEVAPAPY